MKFLQEFKEFAMRGNVVDLAVGVIIGAAFNKIVTSLVSDVIMPPIGMLLGGMDFTSLKITLSPPIDGLKSATLNYGAFIQTIVDFTIVAFSVFLMIKVINALNRKKEATTPTAPPKDIELLTEIRDLLKEKRA